MSFNATRSRGPEWAPFGGRDRGRDRGYPVPNHEVEVGRMTKADILAGVDYAEQIVKSRVTAHNEVTSLLKSGITVVRLRETDIVSIFGDGFVVNTGGWNTITTRRHINNILERHGFSAHVWGDKKAGGPLLRRLIEGEYKETGFKTQVASFANGDAYADPQDT